MKDIDKLWMVSIPGFDEIYLTELRVDLVENDDEFYKVLKATCVEDPNVIYDDCIEFTVRDGKIVVNPMAEDNYFLNLEDAKNFMVMMARDSISRANLGISRLREVILAHSHDIEITEEL